MTTAPPKNAAVEPVERSLMAQAITNIRKQRGLKQKDVAAPLGMTTQAWQKYEAGERDFTAERLARIFSALDITRDQVDAELARLRGDTTRQPTPGLRERGRSDFVFDVYTRPAFGAQGMGLVDAGEVLRRIDLAQLLGPNVDALEHVGDLMAPWVESGETVLYDRDRYPKPGKGCVIETKAGEYHVRIYAGNNGSALFARTLDPQATDTFALSDVAGVYAVRLRGD